MNGQGQPPPFGVRFLTIAAIISFLFAGLGTVVGNRLESPGQNPAEAPPGQSQPRPENGTGNVIDAAKKASSSVVSITATRETRSFLGPIEQKGGGTGFIITNDGLIATNRHVVEGNSNQLTVVASDGKTYEAKVQALDPSVDFALIKIEARNLPVADLGNSESLQVGQEVIAIGNALGEFQNTVTSGVLSAKERTIQAGGEGQQTEQLENLLQTDAAINPGNSGGPLVNLDGQVVAVNTAVAGGGAQGIGFAIPINQAKQAIESYQQRNKIVRPSVGVRFVTITPDVAKLRGLPVETGALLEDGRGGAAVTPGSAAARAGLRAGDIITAVAGQALDGTHTLPGLIEQRKPGEEVELTYRRGAQETKTTVKLDER